MLKHWEGSHVGLDEVGRGPLAGPVVAAAVILPPDFKSDLIRDSKKLSEKKRKLAFDLIIENALDYHIAYVSHQVIDQTNILKATMKAMHDCLDAISSDTQSGFEHILVDGNYFEPYKNVQHTCVVKGDDTYYSIAAASILAKVSRDEYMEELAKTYPEYGWESNKGYGSQKHIQAIKDIGITEFHRLSFLKNIL